MSASNPGIPSSYMSLGSLYFGKSRFVTMLTRSSVHCADNATATSNSKGVVNSSAGFASW